MEKYKCKLCLKKFSNGRALGGHMRSHLLNLPIPPKPREEEFPIYQLNENILSASSSSASEEEEEEEEEEKNGYDYGLRENPKRSVRLVDPEFSFTADVGSVVLPDRESETDSSKNPTRRRSKRTRKLLEHPQYHHQPQQPRQVINNNNNNNKFQVGKVSHKSESWEPEPVSSISETTTEEDVAFCLMMLSRDKWKNKEQQNQHHLQKQQQEEEDQDDEEEEKSFEETDESDEFKSCKATTTRNRGKYKCETCNKWFKSYQALGGHRASHKKLKLNGPIRETEFETENVGASGYVAEKKIKIHECPYCFRVFPSGQALGGHKRTHGTNVAVMAATPARSSSKLGDNLSFIDLNLPAPMEDDDVSQFELSAVSSDADFVDHHHRIKP